MNKALLLESQMVCIFTSATYLHFTLEQQINLFEHEFLQKNGGTRLNTC